MATPRKANTQKITLNLVNSDHLAHWTPATIIRVNKEYSPKLMRHLCEAIQK